MKKQREVVSCPTCGWHSQTKYYAIDPANGNAVPLELVPGHKVRVALFWKYTFMALKKDDIAKYGRENIYPQQDANPDGHEYTEEYFCPSCRMTYIGWWVGGKQGTMVGSNLGFYKYRDAKR